MDLEQHVDIVMSWVNSCVTAEQLDLLTKVVDEFIIRRFSEVQKGKKRKFDLEVIKSDLYEAINTKKLSVAGSAAPTEVPTLDRYLNNPDGENKREA